MTLSAQPGRAPHRRRNGARITATILLACAAVAACSSNDAATAPPKASPTPSTAGPTRTADPAETAKAAAIDTYMQYWQEMERLYADGSGKDADLKRHAASAALKNAEADARRMHDKGLLIIGEVSVGAPTVTRADLGRKVPNVTLSSCLDVSRWRVVDGSTKKSVPLPSDRLTKYVIVSTVERWPQGWRVIKDEPQEKAC
jgi:hypothetical protein